MARGWHLADEGAESPRWPLNWMGSTRGSAGCGRAAVVGCLRAAPARLRLPVRSGWWRTPIQVEALAAFSAWIERYDSGGWDDPRQARAALRHRTMRRFCATAASRSTPIAIGSPSRASVIDVGCQPPPDS